MTGVLPLTSSTPCRRIRLWLPRRRQLMRPDITHFLAARALHSKAVGHDTGGFALAPQRLAVAANHRQDCRTGVQSIGAEHTPGPTPQSYTRASSRFDPSQSSLFHCHKLTYSRAQRAASPFGHLQ